jgi:hypothetical protein
MQLLEGNGWLQSKAWKAFGPDRRNLSFLGVYLICDGGHHHWPCLISPVKAGVPGSAVMKWSSKKESVRKDIEGVFGILKASFKFLKNFHSLKHHASIDNALVTCCVLHNMLLESDGWLDPNLSPYPGGLKERLLKKFCNIYGNTWNGTAGIWNHVEDNTIDEEMERENRRHQQSAANKKDAWATGCAKVTAALVDYHQFWTVVISGNNLN